MAAAYNGSWETAFRASGGHLWLIGADNRGDMGLGVAAGTSPSITTLAGGGWETAVNSGSLWLIGADNRGNMGLGMAPGTSPSITR